MLAAGRLPNLGSGSRPKFTCACFASAYTYGQLRSSETLPFWNALRDSSSIHVSVDLGAEPFLMPCCMNESTCCACGESIVAFLPSLDSTEPPLLYSSSRKFTVKPSYRAP